MRILALVTGGTGLLVLAGAMLSGRYQRLRETVLLRTLGSSRRQLLLIQATEYTILGVLSALLGCGLAAIANALLATYVFKLSPAWPWATLPVAIGLTGGLTLLIGWIANRGLASQSPLAILREET